MIFDFPKNEVAGGGFRPWNPAARWIVFAAWGLVLLAAGCGGRKPPGAVDGGLLRVVATTTVVADLVRQVGGDRVTVDCLMAPGIDPHSYKPTPRDADRLAGADLVVASGLHLEGKLTDLL